MNPLIVYLIYSGKLYNSSGPSKYVRELANFLISRRYRVKIICRHGRVYRFGTETKVKKGLAKTTHSSLSLLIFKLPNPITIVLGIINLLREFKYDKYIPKIIHAHDMTSSLYVAFFLGKIFNIPILIQIHGFPHKEVKLIAMKSKFLWDKLISFFLTILTIIAVKLIKSDSAMLLVNNNEVKYYYQSLGISQDNIIVIPSAINLGEHEKNLISKEEAKKMLWLENSDDLVIGYIGRLAPEKNVKILIKAFSEFISVVGGRAQLVIIGDGPLRLDLERYVRRLGIGNYTRFMGYISDAYRYLNAIDIFVHPSLSEGSPLSLVEAMVAGKAIIASDIPAHREMVKNGKEALLFDPLNPMQLKNLLLTLYHKPQLRKELGYNARKKAEKFDINNVFSEIIKIYTRILNIQFKRI